MFCSYFARPLSSLNQQSVTATRRGAPRLWTLAAPGRAPSLRPLGRSFAYALFIIPARTARELGLSLSPCLSDDPAMGYRLGHSVSLLFSPLRFPSAAIHSASTGGQMQTNHDSRARNR